MSGGRRLDAVAGVARERERSAARDLGERRRSLDEQQARLEELQDHRRRYRDELRSKTSRGLSVGQLNEYRLFLSRLEEAIAHQERLVAHTRQELLRSQAAWLETRKDAKAIGKLVERRRVEERLDRDRREQRENDDRAGQRPGSGPFD